LALQSLPRSFHAAQWRNSLSLLGHWSQLNTQVVEIEVPAEGRRYEKRFRQGFFRL
jgi:hypothetical protein